MFKNRNVFLVLGIIGALVYCQGLSIGLIGDDFQFTFTSFPKNPFFFLFHALPNCLSFRPLQALVMALAQYYFGFFNTFPVHALTLFSHVAVCFLVYYLCIQSGVGRLPAFLSSLFMLVSQTNVMAVSGNDTLSQVLVTMFGCVSLWAFWKAAARGHSRSKQNTLFAVSLASFALCLLSKETAASFFMQLLAVVGLSWFKGKISAKQSIIWGAIFSIVFVSYWALHSSLPVRNPYFGEDTYDFHLGLNIFINAVQFVFSLFSPLSTVAVYTAFYYKDVAFLVFSSLALLIAAGIGVFGTINQRENKIFIGLPLFGIIGFFPLVLMNHVSELYTYQFAPFFSVIIGAGIDRFIAVSKQNRLKIIMVFGIAALFFAGNIVAVENKIACMKRNGDQAKDLFAQISPIIKQAPRGAIVFLVNPHTERPEYSIFQLNGFDALKYGLVPITRLSQRDDLDISIIDLPDLKAWESIKSLNKPPNSALPKVFTLNNDKVIPYVLLDR